MVFFRHHGHFTGNAKEAYFRLIEQTNTLENDKEKSSQSRKLKKELFSEYLNFAIN